jgi:hypothetical protein
MMYGNSSMGYSYSPTAEMIELTTPTFALSSLVQAAADKVVITIPPLLTPPLSLHPLAGMMVQEDITKNN